MPWWVKIGHWFGRCLRCRLHETEDGIGGKCIDCGKVHGWMTRDELRRISFMRTSNPHWGKAECDEALRMMRSR